jgi:hypothetical protein
MFLQQWVDRQVEATLAQPDPAAWLRPSVELAGLEPRLARVLALAQQQQQQQGRGQGRQGQPPPGQRASPLDVLLGRLELLVNPHAAQASGAPELEYRCGGGGGPCWRRPLLAALAGAPRRRRACALLACHPRRVMARGALAPACPAGRCPRAWRTTLPLPTSPSFWG